MAQWLRAQTSFTEDPDLVPSTHTVVPNHLNSNSKGADTIFWPLLAPDTHVGAHTYL